jgi:hypothetical protein
MRMRERSRVIGINTLSGREGIVLVSSCGRSFGAVIWI